MKIKLINVVNAGPALARLFACGPKKARDTFVLARIERVVTPVLDDYDTARLALLKRYASKDPEKPNRFRFIKLDGDGEPVLNDEKETVRDDEAIKAYESEYDELVDETVEIGVDRIPLAFVDRISLEPAMTPTEMSALWWLIEGFEEE